jgi:pimeloyl-ACP methyl ester carboxylesterase
MRSAQAQPIAAAITGAQLVMLPGCGHIPSIETPQQYRHAVAEFLRS